MRTFRSAVLLREQSPKQMWNSHSMVLKKIFALQTSRNKTMKAVLKGTEQDTSVLVILPEENIALLIFTYLFY